MTEEQVTTDVVAAPAAEVVPKPELAVEPKPVVDEGPSLAEIQAENAKLKSAMMDLEAGTDLTKLKERVAHKEQVIVQTQSSNKKLAEEVESYRTVVDAIVTDLSKGVDQEWIDTISDLPVTKQLALLRKLQGTTPVASPRSPTAPTASVADAVSGYEAEVAKMRADPNTTQKQWESLWARYTNKDEVKF